MSLLFRKFRASFSSGISSSACFSIDRLSSSFLYGVIEFSSSSADNLSKNVLSADFSLSLVISATLLFRMLKFLSSLSLRNCGSQGSNLSATTFFVIISPRTELSNLSCVTNLRSTGSKSAVFSSI